MESKDNNIDTILDSRMAQKNKPELSIEPQLEVPYIILNAGKTTNFTYKIENLALNSKEIEAINNIQGKRKIKDRIDAIYSRGGTLKFQKVDRQIFNNNLILIDSLLPEIMAQIVFLYYTSDNTTITDLLSALKTQNPLNYDTSNEHQFYTYKVKRFLTDISLGMMPSKVWTGHYDATGGYIIVKENGDVICYHIYNRNDFDT